MSRSVQRSLAILVSLAGACGGSHGGAGASGPAQPAAAQPAAAGPAVASPGAAKPESQPPAPGAEVKPPAMAGLPDTPAGRQLGWVLAAMHRGAAALDDATLQAHFAPAFLAKVPAAQLRLVLAQLDQAGPFTVKDIGKAFDRRAPGGRDRGQGHPASQHHR